MNRLKVGLVIVIVLGLALTIISINTEELEKSEERNKKITELDLEFEELKELAESNGLEFNFTQFEETITSAKEDLANRNTDEATGVSLTIIKDGNYTMAIDQDSNVVYKGYDETEIIQNALLFGVRDIILGNHVFVLTNTLLPNSDTIITLDCNAVITIPDGSNLTIFLINAKKNVVIQSSCGGTLDGNRDTQTVPPDLQSGIGIWIGEKTNRFPSENITIDGLVIQNMGGIGIYVTSTSHDVLIQNVEIKNNSSKGINISCCPTDVLIINNSVHTDGQNARHNHFGIEIDDGASFVFVYGNKINVEGDSGISVHNHAGKSPKNIIISTNVITDGKHGIQLKPSKNGFNDIQNIIVTDNTISDVSGFGIYVDFNDLESSGPHVLDGALITDNLLQNTQGIFIHPNMKNIVVANNLELQ